MPICQMSFNKESSHSLWAMRNKVFDEFYRRSWFNQCFTHAFFIQKFVQSQTLSREKLLKRLLYKKCSRKILMKLTPGVDLILFLLMRSKNVDYLESKNKLPLMIKFFLKSPLMKKLLTIFLYRHYRRFWLLPFCFWIITRGLSVNNVTHILPFLIQILVFSYMYVIIHLSFNILWNKNQHRKNIQT